MAAKEEERWKTSLLTLPDRIFFALIRNYLGGITTPFNKHDLIRDLATFLKKPSTRDRILRLLDDSDRVILTALWFLGTVSPEDLYRILHDKIPFGLFMQRVASLRERLLVYTEGEEQGTLLHLNPILRPSLEKHAVGFGYLFSTRPHSDGGKPPWLTEHVITALCSFTGTYPKALSPDGAVRRQNRDAFMTAFPGWQLEEGRSDALAAALHGMKGIGLLPREQTCATIDPAALEEFLSTAPSDRLIGLYGSAAFGAEDPSPDAPTASRLFIQVIDSFPRDQAMCETDVLCYLSMCALFEGVALEPGAAMERLLLLRVFLRHSDGYIALNPEVYDRLKGKEVPPERAVFQPNFDLLIPESTPPEKLAAVPRLFRLKKYERFAEYTLDQDSFVDYLDAGGTAESAATRIENITGVVPPPHAVTSLALWEEKYRSISVFCGTLVRVSEEMEPFLQHSPAFSAAVREHLGKGIYFLGDTGPDELREILKKAGIGHPPGISSNGQVHHDVPNRIIPVDAPSRLLFASGSSPEPLEHRDGAFLEELKQALYEEDLPEAVKKEFENRIERRLILHRKQFSRDIDRQTRREARGLDYTGKIRLIEEALAAGNILLELPAQPGSEDMLILKPLSLSGSGGDSVLTGLLLPEETRKNFPVRKISRIRLVSGYLIPFCP